MTKTFNNWLKEHSDPAHALFYLLEVSTEFPKGEINSLFRQQLDRRASQLGISENQLIQMHEFDWVGYIARSLRNAGFSDDQIDLMTQDIVVRLLVKPGKLFSAWDGNAPIMARFKTSVRNAVINLAQKRQTRRRNIPSRSIHHEFGLDMAAQSEPTDNEMIDQFRNLVRDRLGELGTAILDRRLVGEDVKDLIGSEEYGSPSSYRVKETVKAIKTLAQQFGDQDFQKMVARAMAEEEETVRKRFAGHNLSK
jgi:hypothetical protein